MSWAEVKKVNSDMQEPLNYSHYISDISVFGAKSFIMSPENTGLWDEMALKSRRLYGHRAIHDYVYNRLTGQNIDTLFEQSGILGEQVNAFHQTGQYQGGGAEGFLRGMTLKGCQALSDKFRQGYQRYAEKRMTSPETGRWLNQTFHLDSPELEAKGSWLEILDDAQLIALLLPCEAAITAVTSSKGAMDALVSHPTAIPLISEQIALFAQSEIVWRSAVNNQDLMAAVFQNPEAFSVVSGSEPAMRAILRSEPAMLALLKTPAALETLGGNQTAMKAIVDAAAEISKASTALEQVQACMQTINQELPDIAGTETITESMAKAEVTVTLSLETLRPVVLAAVTSDKMMRLLFQNKGAMEAIAASPEAMNAIGTCPGAVLIAETCPVAMAAIQASDMAVAKFIVGQAGFPSSSFNDMASVGSNLTVMRGIAASSRAMATISGSPLALEELGKASSATVPLTADVIALHAIILSPYREHIFQFAAFRNAVNNSKKLFDNVKYFTAQTRTARAVRCDASSHSLIQPEIGKIYLATFLNVSDTAPQDEGGSNVINLFDYDSTTKRVSNLTVAASRTAVVGYAISTFLSIKPMFERVSSTGKYPGEVGLSLNYTEYTAI